MKIRLQITSLLLFSLPWSATPGGETFWSNASVMPRPAGAPSYGDVVFSIRWNRSRSNLHHARQFHATRIEWSYISDYSWINYVKEKGYAITGALNTSLSDQPVQPGQRGTYDVCYCEHCRKLAAKRVSDIHDRQTRSLIGRHGLRRMYETAVKETRKINPAIVWSKNKHVESWYESIFDYDFAELDPHDGIAPATFRQLRQRTGRPGRFQIYTLRSGDVLTNQQTIALGYATGSLISAPYDVYPADGYLTKERYYGKAFHYAPLYALVRFSSSLLDAYEDSFFDMDGTVDARWTEKPVWIQGHPTAEHPVFARVQPGHPESGVVIHLLDRSGRKTCHGLVVNLRDSAISSPGAPPRCVFHSTIPYVKEAHAQAEAEALALANETGSLASPVCGSPYLPLVERTQIEPEWEDGIWKLALPDFALYGILHVGPKANTRWQLEP